MINVKNIIEPVFAIESYKEELIKIYKNDYKDKYSDIIRKRIDNTFYLFENDPTITFEFMRKFKKDVSTSRYIKSYIENLNYKMKLLKIHDASVDYYYNLTTKFFEEERKKAKIIEKLDVESFCSRSVAILNSNSYSDIEKANILERQKKYLEDCHNLGVKPLTDPNTIDKVINSNNYVIYLRNLYLLENTIWGKNLLKKAKKFSKYLDKEKIAITFASFNAACMRYIIEDNSYKYLIYFPIIDRLSLSSLDRIIFHEMRHVIEGCDTSTGISDRFSNKYDILNEIRTEKNAINDSIILKDKVLFSNEGVSTEYYNYYEKLFPYTGGFFEEYHDFLNEVAINGNIDILEDRFKKENLLIFDNFLNETLQLVKLNSKINKEERIKKGYEIVKKMK